MSRGRVPRSTSALCLLTAVLLVMAGCGGSKPSAPKRSAKSFCAELSSGNDRMRENYEQANDGAGSQLAMIAANVGEFTRLVHRMDEAAPEEIATEMSDARKAWDSTADAMSEAASDPIKALAAGLMTSVMASASTRAVDTYAAEHCDGVTVFGTVATGSSSTGDAIACPETTAEGYRPLSSEYSFADLQTQLEAMSGSSDSDLAAAATSLSGALSVLDPAPAYSAEGLGRLEWTSAGSGQELFGALAEALAAACPGYTADPEALSTWFGALAPGASDGTYRVGSAYGRCEHDAGWAQGRQVLWCEETGEAVVVDYATGEASTFTPEGLEPSEDPENPDAEDDGSQDETYPELWATTDGIAWTSVANTPASGLDVQRWEATLHVVDLDGAEKFTTVVDSGSGAAVGDSDISWGYAIDDILVLPLPSGTTAVDAASGDQRWIRKDVFGQLWWVTPHTISVDQDLLDVHTGKTVANYYGSSATTTTAPRDS